jgi:uncharacterized protein (DUF2249 family)
MDHVLDVADLPPPEPLERTLDALSSLPSGDRLLLRLPRQPLPLYSLLRQMGYRWEVRGHDGDWEVCIESEAGVDPHP